MITAFLSIAVVFSTLFAVAPGDCSKELSEMGLPFRVKTSGKPKAANWGRVNKIIGEHLLATGQLGGCDVSFQQVFSPNREDAYFPVLFNLLRLVPEDSLNGAEVYTRDGTLLGHFANVVIFEKRGVYNYKRPYFQYRDRQGELQSAGNPELIDIPRKQPLFMLKWEDIRGKELLSSRAGAK